MRAEQKQVRKVGKRGVGMGIVEKIRVGVKKSLNIRRE